MNDIKSTEIIGVLETGIKRGKKARKVRKVVNINILVLAFIIIAFSVSVNVSSALASSLSNVPVLGRFVKFIRIGSGYENVAENGYFSKGEIIAEDERFKVSIEGYYYSDNNLNVIIGLKGDIRDDCFYNLRNVNIFNPDMSALEIDNTSYENFDYRDNIFVSELVINKQDGSLPEGIILSFDISEVESYGFTPSGITDSDYIYRNLEVHLSKQVLLENFEIDINQSYEVSDMELQMHSLTITPTTMNLHFDVISDSMVFYGFDNIYIKSGNKVYSRISNGITASGSMETGITYFFNSSYFDANQPLTLVFDGINVLPKDYSTIVIDVSDGKTIKSIDGSVVFDRVEDNGDSSLDLYFTSNFDRQILFKSYNGEYFPEESMHGNNVYILKVEKEHIVDSMIEIDFYYYPAKIEFYKEMAIN